MFGIYIHIPYCIQRCLYCDFATYEKSQILPPQEYIQLLQEEMRQKSNYFMPRDVDTIYFGGGTPSLIEPHLLEKAITTLQSLGFKAKPTAEITMEINPATITHEKMRQYRQIGINRYSVGAQTFSDSLLKKIGREHNSQQTLETLSLLRSESENFNFDILFALPNQRLDDLEKDLNLALQQGAHHISPYCLTIPKAHVLSQGRPPEDEQVAMFEAVKKSLFENGYQRYEISNFAKPGFESRHNLLYWQDHEYWGLGLSAHSYSKSSPWGTRFWNVNNINEYEKQIRKHTGERFESLTQSLPKEQYEVLNIHQSLTDFTHTSLRLMTGLSLEALSTKFPLSVKNLVEKRLEVLLKRGLVVAQKDHFCLSDQGLLLSNLVFEKMAFLEDELAPRPH